MALLIACLGCTAPPPNASLSAREVRILRDDFGVPHIYANDVFGLFYGYGYALAQDRLFQLEMGSRSVQGRVAEVRGPKWLAFDTETRRGFDPRDIARQIAELDPDDRHVLEGMAAGINAWVKRVRSAPGEHLPKEFGEFVFEPSLWTARDVAMMFIGRLANRFADYNSELENAHILSELVALHGERDARSIFDQLNPTHSAVAPTTIGGEDWLTDATPRRAPALTTPPVFAPALSPATRGPAPAGTSYCFVLGPERALGADAILLNGPQFGFFAPAFVYSVGLHGAGFDLVGNTPVGLPVLLFGHNRRIAWGSTWGAGDMVDIYRETLHPEDAERYLHRGRYRAFEKRSETIPVRGAEAVVVVYRSSVHGPVIHRDVEHGVAFSKKRSWAGRELQSLFAWLHSTRATTPAEWLMHAKRQALNINWYYADARGNIAYAFTGAYPRRASGHDGRLPADGRGDFEWEGQVPFAENPQVVNPTRGYLANWNNKPAPGAANPDLHWYSWSRADRVAVLDAALRSRARHTPEEAWQVIETLAYADLHLVYLRPLFQELQERLAPTDKSTGAALRLLLRWDGRSRDDDADGFHDGAATPIFRAFMRELVQRVLADDLGPLSPLFSGTGYPEVGQATGSGSNIQTGVKAVLGALLGDAEGYDLLNGTAPGVVVSDALAVALRSLSEQQGSALERWRSPVARHRFSTTNFLGVPQSVSSRPFSLRITQNRGTENNMFVLKDGEIIGYEVTPPGQNGFVAPDGTRGAHFDDQLQLFGAFGRKRMWFRAEDVLARAESDTLLRY